MDLEPSIMEALSLLDWPTGMAGGSSTPLWVHVKRIPRPARLPTAPEPGGRGESPGQVEQEIPTSRPLQLPGYVAGKIQA